MSVILFSLLCLAVWTVLALVVGVIAGLCIAAADRKTEQEPADVEPLYVPGTWVA